MFTKSSKTEITYKIDFSDIYYKVESLHSIVSDIKLNSSNKDKLFFRFGRRIERLKFQLHFARKSLLMSRNYLKEIGDEYTSKYTHKTYE